MIDVREDGGVDLINVEAMIPGRGPEVLGYGYVPARDDDANPWFTVKLPDIEDGAELRLAIHGIATGSAGSPDGQPPISDALRLLNKPSGGRGEGRIWTVSRAARSLTYDYFTADQPIPIDVVSTLWTSRREGSILYPAEQGSDGGTLPTVKLDVSYLKEDNGKPALPVQLKLTLAHMPGDNPVTDTKFDVFTVPAASSVELFLRSERGALAGRQNKAELLLRHSDGPKSLYLPEEEEDTDDTHSYAGTEDTSAPRAPSQDVSLGFDYLDRIIISSVPPVSFQVNHVDKGLLPCSAAGSVALIYLHNGELAVDEGGLSERLFPKEQGEGSHDVFMIEMERFDYRADPSDLANASEISLLHYAEVVRGISDAYGAGAGRLLPLDFQDFAASPSYFALVANMPRVENLTELIEALSFGGDALGEAEKVGHLARGLIEDLCESDPDDPRMKRLALWAEHARDNTEGWKFVPVALHQKVRDGVCAGLDFGASGLGMFIDFVSRPRNADLIADTADLADQLTNVGALPLEHSAQFTSVREMQKRLNLLDDIAETVDETVQRAERTLAVASLDPHDMQDRLADLAEFRPVRRQRSQNRAVRFIAEKIRGLLSPIVLGNMEVKPDTLVDTLSNYFFERVRKDFEIVEGIVSRGYLDPIPEKIVELGTHGMGERPVDGFRRPLTPEQQDWLFGESPKATGLAEEWRLRLREDYQTHNQARPDSG